MTIGRLLCLVGWHHWESRTESTRTAIVTFNRCARPECPRYAQEFVVDLERRPALGRGLCSCRKGAWDPQCLVHGRTAA